MALLSGQKLTASLLNAGPTAYTPTLTATTTNPTLGSGSTATGFYYRTLKTVVVNFTFIFGTSGVGAGSGTFLVSLPSGLPADLSYHLAGAGQGQNSAVGAASMRDSSAAVTAWRTGTCWLSSATELRIAIADNGVVSNSTPWTWAASDGITGQAIYVTP